MRKKERKHERKGLPRYHPLHTCKSQTSLIAIFHRNCDDRHVGFDYAEGLCAFPEPYRDGQLQWRRRVINYTVGSWNPGGVGGSNPDIRVFFNGAVAADGALDPNTTPPDQFSGTLTAPQGTNTVDVVATAESAWDDGFAAGDSSSVVTVTIPTNCAPGTGRFTGGGKQVTVDGIAVTKGFEVDCDLHQPSNNLEINWGSNHFHMTAFLSAVCTFVKKPNPPTAPVNTIVATGTGRYNNSNGYTVEFTLIDNGEPGTSDEISFKVYETANPSNVVLDTGGLNFISGGNVQAHVDQH